MHREIMVALVAPGWSARRRRPVLAAVLLVVGVLVPLALLAYVIGSGRNAIALGLDGAVLGVVIACGVASLLARAVALADIWAAAGRPRRVRGWDLVASVVAGIVLVVGSFGVARVGMARAVLDETFTGSGGAPLFVADDAPVTVTSTTTAPEPTTPVTETTRPPLQPADTIVVTTTTTTIPPLPKRPDSGVSAEQLADVTTVLLLGGDAGPGRGGLRTDTMMLFSLHKPSGRASLVSLPRDMRGLLFPPGSALEARHPYGFDNLANAVYPIVSADRSLRDAYQVEGVHPGVVATAHAIGYSLDVTIDDYVLVDMQGFLDLVDALGGVTVNVTKRIPMPGNVPGARTQYPDTIGPGLIEMDGSTALGYVRSRYADSDYQRTARQRSLLAALATQISVTDVLANYGAVTNAVGGTLRTSLTPDELADTLAVIGGETAIVESVGLVPPLADIRRPDFDALAKVVGQVRLALVTGERSGY